MSRQPINRICTLQNTFILLTILWLLIVIYIALLHTKTSISIINIQTIPVIKEPYNLIWPPLQYDNTIPLEDGYDIMPLMGIKIPRLWTPFPGDDLNNIGSKINGYETIMLMIASYRDFQCRETIELAYSNAEHPERLFVGAVDQRINGDIGCLDLEIPCSINPNRNICKYMHQISIFTMDARFATGPVTARHIGYRLYRGQYYFMQLDAHCHFADNWDTSIIAQFKETGNEMAVLSVYAQSTLAPRDKRRPIMCASEFSHQEGNVWLITHLAQPFNLPAIDSMPQLQPFWAAGLSFSRGHFAIRVPYDPYLPMVFGGEEIEIAIRGFTFGYDFYAPRSSVVFHEYSENSERRRKIKMYWEDNGEGHLGEEIKSLKRLMSVIQLGKNFSLDEYDNREIDKYNIGNVRPIELYYKIFGINRVEHTIQRNICAFVKFGVMHTYFQSFLHANGMGIDYSHLVNFDMNVTMATILANKKKASQVRVT